MLLTIKNYKQLEGWAHNYKDLRIGEIGETADNYIFRVAYNSIPYTIKIFRTKLITNEYEIVVRDGADMVQYGRHWITKNHIKINKITNTFENLIISSKPMARQTTGKTNFNNPF